MKWRWGSFTGLAWGGSECSSIDRSSIDSLPVDLAWQGFLIKWIPNLVYLSETNNVMSYKCKHFIDQF